MKRWWIVVVVVYALLVVVICGIQAQRARTSNNRASSTIVLLQEFHYIEGRWCWRGLCLAHTPFSEASTLLRDVTMFGDLARIKNQGTSSITWQWRTHPSWSSVLIRPSGDDKISRFNFNFQADTILLADALELFGPPDTLYIQGTGTDLAIQICFDRHICVWIAQRTGEISPAAPLTGLDFMTAQAYNSSYGSEEIDWHGFTNYTPGWWYRFLH